MSTRYTIEISIAAIDEAGDWVKEWDGLSLDLAASDSDPLEGIMSLMYDTGMAGMEALRSEEDIAVSDRRPNGEDELEEQSELPKTPHMHVWHVKRRSRPC